jgi:hypothetical protein
MEHGADSHRDSETAADPRDLDINDQFGDHAVEHDSALAGTDSLDTHEHLTDADDLSVHDVVLDADDDSDEDAGEGTR